MSSVHVGRHRLSISGNSASTESDSAYLLSLPYACTRKKLRRLSPKESVDGLHDTIQDSFRDWLRTADYSLKVNEARRETLCSDACAKYFARLIVMAGFRGENHLVAQAWELCMRSLAITRDDPDFLSSESRYTHSSDHQLCVPSDSHLSGAFKAVMITAVSLAVDVAGDFEGAYTSSNIAWSHLLLLEVSGRTEESSMSHLITRKDMLEVKSTCMNFIRMKFMLSNALGWTVRSATAADYFAYLCSKTCNLCSECFRVQRNMACFNRVVDEIFETCGLILISRSSGIQKDHNCIAAVLVLLVATAQSHHKSAIHIAPTPLRPSTGLLLKYFDNAAEVMATGCVVDGCLAKLIPKESMDAAMQILSSPNLKSELASLIDLLRAGYASAKSSRILADIEDSYYVNEDLQSDVADEDDSN